MARVKGGMNAKRRHNKVLQRRKIQTVQSGKAVCYAGTGFILCRQKAEKETVQKTVDCPDQCGRKNERTVLQQVYVRLKAGRRGDEQKDAG